MAAPTQYYVDPAWGGPFNGTAAQPWVSVAAALVAIVRDAVNGDQINIVSDQPPGVTTTTDDIFAASITLVAYGAPTIDAPLIFRGCARTALLGGLPAANNGGIGGMDGNAGGFSIFDGLVGNWDFVHFIDMHLYNTAAATVMTTDTDSSLINCEIDTSTNRGLTLGFYGKVLNCHFHDITGRDLVLDAYCQARGNFINTSSASGILLSSAHNTVSRNIIATNAVGTDAIVVSFYNQSVFGNSILSTVASTSAGINFDAGTHRDCMIHDNLIEGFNGVGGSGIDFGGAGQHVTSYANNAFHDNTDDEINPCDINFQEGQDYDMPASPFLKDGAVTFANRFNYFKPAIPVRGRSFPNGCRFDRGAVQVRLATEREIAAVTLTSIPARTALDPL